MKHGSLFSGIGGFDLAAEWMGWENVFHCEIAEFPRKILNHYWPKSESYEDIKKTDFTKWHGTVDIISGGFPCQPYSAAGKRLGKEDDRHLWPEMLRVIREVKPQWVVGENVRGLLNWNGGMVFHEVCADLENIGYEVQAFIIPASGVNAPHQRERLWIVANSVNYNRRSAQSRWHEKKEYFFSESKRFSKEWFTANIDNTSERGFNALNDIDQSNGIGNATDSQNYGRKTDERINNGTKYKSNDRDTIRNIFNTDGKQRDVADTNLHGFNQRNGNDKINASEKRFNTLNDIDKAIMYSNGTSKQRKYIGQEREGKFNRPNSGNGFDNFQNFPTQSPVCGGDDGISHGLDNITFSKWRNESIKGYGNAIVPQVAYRIFKTIEYIQNLK
jgi:DNA (cytosine-5)-methyltransferase 1